MERPQVLVLSMTVLLSSILRTWPSISQLSSFWVVSRVRYWMLVYSHFRVTLILVDWTHQLMSIQTILTLMTPA